MPRPKSVPEPSALWPGPLSAVRRETVRGWDECVPGTGFICTIRSDWEGPCPHPERQRDTGSVIQTKLDTLLFGLRDPVLLSTLAALTALLVALCWLWIPVAPSQEWRTWVVEEGRLLAQASASAREVIAVEAADFERLRQLQGRLQATANRLEALPAPQPHGAFQRAVAKELPAYLEALGALVGQEQPLGVIAHTATQLSEVLPRLDMAVSRLARSLVEHKQPRRQIYLVSQLNVLSERIENHLLRLLQPHASAATSSDLFGRDVALFGRILHGLAGGDKAQGLAAIDHPKSRSSLLEVEALFPTMESQAERLLNHAPALVAAHRTFGTLVDMNRRLQRQVEGVLADPSGDDHGASMPVAVFLVGALLFAGAGLLIWRRTLTTVRQP